jgi:hypothetical protein
MVGSAGPAPAHGERRIVIAAPPPISGTMTVPSQPGLAPWFFNVRAPAGEPGRALSGATPALGISTASAISAALMLAVLPALLALFPPLLPCLPVLLALLAVLLALLPALLALFPALLAIHGLVLIPATTAALAIALSPGSVSASAAPAPTWLVASVSSVSPAHVFLLVLSIALHNSVSCTRSGTGVTPAGQPASGSACRA